MKFPRIKQRQELLALLAILALGNRQIGCGKVMSAAQAMRLVRGRVAS